jgi:hypothetical protein
MTQWIVLEQIQVDVEGEQRGVWIARAPIELEPKQAGRSAIRVYMQDNVPPEQWPDHEYVAVQLTNWNPLRTKVTPGPPLLELMPARAPVSA